MTQRCVFLSEGCPSLIQEWHPTKNGNRTPDNVALMCNNEFWWIYPYDDPITGRHFDFEWRARVSNRVKGDGCPYLSGEAVWQGFNDLATKRPDLVKEWNYSRNGDLTPEMVTERSGKKVWWIYPYDDPVTGKHFDFEWKTRIVYRVRGFGCPFISGKAVWAGFNDLATKRPDIAVQWCKEKNGKLTPQQVTENSHKKVWWIYPYDDPETGKHFDFIWKASVKDRNQGRGCPYLTGKAVWPGYNDLATKNPELAAQWNFRKNGGLTPFDVRPNTHKKVWWEQLYDDPRSGRQFLFEWQATVNRRNEGDGCPYIANQKVWYGFNDLETLFPQTAVEWSMVKNKNRKPSEVLAFDSRKAWWLCSDCGKLWYCSPQRRAEGKQCSCRLMRVC